jgi:DNA-binding MarR family transcriptional regulator
VNYFERHFVPMPDFVQLTKRGLSYLDVLVYVAIKDHYNPANGYCWPSQEVLITLTGLSRTFISESVHRLEKADYFEVEYSTCKGWCNQYFFEERLPHFERIPKEFFTATEDLTSNEKAMLLCLRQCYKGELPESDYSIKQFAQYLGLSESQVRHQYKALLAKGYLAERFVTSTNDRKGQLRRYFNNDKLDWRYLYHKERIEHERKRYWFDWQKEKLADRMDVSHLVFNLAEPFTLILS